ncbi:MAG: hypothetical protein HYY63_06105 [Elusimicrobia bacterium]|nr:hypothetical protein [Elusimicrobiota bacterium]
MVRKIKKYKISLRPSFVLRNVKKKSPLQKSEEETEIQIQSEIERTSALLEPVALYETFSCGSVPETLKPLLSQSPESVSLSLIATTIGTPLESEIQKLRAQDTHQSAVLEAIASEALDQSLNFVLKLIGEESKLENCDCSPPWLLESSQLKHSLELLQSQKAGISVDENSQISPLYSRVSFCFWNPIKKR